MATQLHLESVEAEEIVSPEAKKASRPHTRAAALRHSCSLDAVPETCHAEIVHLTSDATTNRQLARLGIEKGATVYVRRAAPLGGALLVEVGGSTVALGRGLARRVRVRLLPLQATTPRRAES